MQQLKNIILLFFTFLLLFVSEMSAQHFTGKPGFYFKGSADIPTPDNAFTIPFVDGIFVLTKWSSIEPEKNVYDWSYLDSEIFKAKNANKDISIGILDPPDWIHDSLDASVYFYIKDNPYSPYHGDTLMGYITWDQIYTGQLDTFTNRLAEKYAVDTCIKYFNLVPSLISRGFPDSVITDTGIAPFWTEFDYSADTVLSVLKSQLDKYMALFPNTPLWNSVDYIRFENKASGNAPNFLISQYVEYGVEKYPDRFGLWRENLSACIDWGLQNPNMVWYTMAQYECRHGSQLLWSLQDGPTRMNQCNIVPNDYSKQSKIAVLDSIFKLATSIGMRYYEFYPGDLFDPDLQNIFAEWHISLDTMCQVATSFYEYPTYNDNITVYPNPTNGTVIIQSETDYRVLKITIYNVFGEMVKSYTNQLELDISSLPNGYYYMKVTLDNKDTVKKIVKTG